MPRAKKSRDEKREESRRQILDAAMELFYEKGYDETTTRDIIKKTGILNGSLYNRFPSKGDILLAIVSEYLEDTASTFDRMYGKDKPPIMAFSIPGALLLYVSCHSPKAAGLIYSASCSMEAINMYIDFYRGWAQTVFGGDLKFDTASEENLVKMSSIIGMVGNMCGRYAAGSSVGFKESFGFVVQAASTLMSLPVFDIPSLADDVVAALDALDVTVCGIRLREFPDYR